jgi:hypothetical protein
MRKIVIILLFSLPFVLKVNAQSDDPKMQVMLKMRDLKDALIAKDSVSLASLLNDDVSYGHSNGLIQTKLQLIGDVMSGVQDYKTIESSELNVRMYDNTAIVTTNVKVNLNFAGKPTNLSLYVTSTWVKINGNWELVARQSVKLPG